jgi:uncharacterized membrane protein
MPARLTMVTRSLIALITAVVAISCASGDEPLGVVDPGAVPDTTTYDQVFSIIQRDCVPCHDEGGTEPRYDTCEDVLANYDDLIEEVFVKNTMPPGAWPRLSSEARLVIQRWDGEAPCTE